MRWPVATSPVIAHAIAAMVAFATFFPVPGDAAPAEAVANRSFEVTIADGRLGGGARTLEVQRGDKVTLRIGADRATTVHLHGYDIELKIEPGVAAVMAFEAHATGRFPLELHPPSGRHVTLLHVEVHPR